LYRNDVTSLWSFPAMESAMEEFNAAPLAFCLQRWRLFALIVPVIGFVVFLCVKFPGSTTTYQYAGLSDTELKGKFLAEATQEAEVFDYDAESPKLHYRDPAWRPKWQKWDELQEKKNEKIIELYNVKVDARNERVEMSNARFKHRSELEEYMNIFQASLILTAFLIACFVRYAYEHLRTCCCPRQASEAEEEAETSRALTKVEPDQWDRNWFKPNKRYTPYYKPVPLKSICAAPQPQLSETTPQSSPGIIEIPSPRSGMEIIELNPSPRRPKNPVIEPPEALGSMDLSELISQARRRANRPKSSRANPRRNKQTVESTPRTCAGCGQTLPWNRLKCVCNVAHYCNIKCQKSHWKSHKQQCKRVRTVKKSRVPVANELLVEEIN